jgi:predicted AlkP superfamily pyrophosphatase or phosphodiesterase
MRAVHKTLVLNIVGLTPALIGQHTPHLRALRDAGGLAHIQSAFPAVTCSAQTDYLTGTLPREHGIVGNGWYFRDTQEVRFWQQADGLVQRPRIWDIARQRDPAFTCANLFWWYAMYCGADWTVTPRPMYPADGRKVPDVWTHPASLRDDLQAELGQFPLFKFWGPAADITCSRWIADAALRVDRRFDPTLTLVYLPHLDYSLQKLGPGHAAIPAELRAIDAEAGRLIDHFRGRGARVIVLSEYGIVPVSRPVHINRVLREVDLLEVRHELGTERLDPGASRAFAAVDHQVAHVYVRQRDDLPRVRYVLDQVPGVAAVLDDTEKAAVGLDHPRAGDLVVLAEPDAWFTYYYWLDDRLAPDYARTVDIHRKPGYDPVELFLDPARRLIKGRIAAKLLARKMGFRPLLDVIPLDATLVRGSHGLSTVGDAGPLVLSDQPSLASASPLASTEVFDLILRHVFEG